jgi:hypothetical protein
VKLSSQDSRLEPLEMRLLEANPRRADIEANEIPTSINSLNHVFSDVPFDQMIPVKIGKEIT